MKATLLSILLSVAALIRAAAGNDGLNLCRPNIETGRRRILRSGESMVPVPRLRRPCGLGRALRSRRRKGHPAGEQLLDYQWQHIPPAPTSPSSGRATGRLWRGPKANRGAMIALILAELAEGKGRFIDQLANGVWLAAQQPSWVLSATKGDSEASGRFPMPAKTAHRPRIGTLRLHRLHRLSLLPPGIRQTRPPPSRSPRRTPSGETSSTRTSIPDNGAPTGGWDWRPGIDAQQLDAVVQFGCDPVLPADGERPGAARPGRGPVGPIHGPVPQLHSEGRGLREGPAYWGRGGREGLRLPPDSVRRLGRRVLAIRQ